MPGANGRTKFKKEKRKRMEIEAVTSAMMRICQQHGFEVTNAQELPGILKRVLSGEGAQTPVPAARPALQPDVVHSHTDIHVIVELGSAPDADWDLDSKASQARAAPTTTPAALPEHLEIDDEMLAAYQDGQNKVIARVARDGVQYKNSPSPHTVEGRPMSVHPSAAPTRRGPQRTAPPDGLEPFGVEFNDPGGFDLADPDDLTRESSNDAISSGDDDSPVNLKTGLSLEQQRDLIAKATGSRPLQPEAGMPNTMK